MSSGRIPSVEGGIQPTIVDAKGDLIVATAADTVSRLAVGSDGDTLVADSSTSTGLRWQGNFAAGKNKIINGDFGIWQRGTSGTTATYGVYAAPDRFGFSSIGGTTTISRQAFTVGSAPVSGYESQYFCRVAPGASTTYTDFGQPIEDVRTFAGQTVTFSFWAKAASSVTFTPTLYQNFGSGGSSTVSTSGSNVTLTSSWTRYSVTVTLPSISGKTLGAGNNLAAYCISTSGTLVGNNIDIWGFQLEAGSVATAFQTATGTLAGELAACRRYLPAFTGSNFLEYVGYAYGTNQSIYVLPFDVPARVVPTGVTVSGTILGYALNVSTSVTPTFNASGLYAGSVTTTQTITAGQGSRIQIQSGASILFTGCEL